MLRSTFQLISNKLLHNKICHHQIIVRQNREIKRWVAPTLKEIRKRKSKINDTFVKRSSFLDWNMDVELYAFSKRLNENFDLSLLQQAFTHRSYVIQEELKQKEVGIEESLITIPDNRDLINIGEEIMSEYIKSFLKLSLPKYPNEGIMAIHNYLMSNETLSYVSSHLGTKDIILTSEDIIEDQTFSNTLKAIIGALKESSGNSQTYAFIRDFVCTQLNQKDINEFWIIDDPLTRLEELCLKDKFESPEPRLIGDLGKNTILSTYNIGIYCNKKLIGKGFGEDIDTAIDQAILNSLHRFYGTEETTMKPFNYQLNIDKLFKDDKISAI